MTRQTPLSRGAIASVLAALKLADLQGFDPQPENAVAAGSFCFAPPGLPPQQVRVVFVHTTMCCTTMWCSAECTVKVLHAL